MIEEEINYDIKIGDIRFYCFNCGTLQKCFVKENKIGKTTCPRCGCEAVIFLGRRYTEFKVYPPKKQN